MSQTDQISNVASASVDTRPEHVSSAYNVLIIVLSFIGATIAGVLLWAHNNHVELPCTANGGCTTVENSVYSHISVGRYSIHVAILGLAAYVALFTLGMMKFGSETAAGYLRLARLGLALSAAGFAFSWYLQYVAHFIIRAFCPWCFTSACDITLILILSGLEHARLRAGGTEK
ncbi:MAG: vitamin K epoxide reductase family protein [Capsulimonadaceae bacterium]